MRKLNQICAQLPITSRETYEKHAFGEYSDIATVNLLASITKGFELLNELFSDYKISYGKEFADEADEMMMFVRGGHDEDMMGRMMDKKRGSRPRMF